MALDVGDKRIGVALSDPTYTIASGLLTVHRAGLKKDLSVLAALVTEHAVERIVVGWPLMMSGQPGAQAFKVAKFTDALAQRVTVPFERWDERLTTVVAERALIEGHVRRAQRRQVVDMVAATLILQSWLDARAARA